MKTPAWVRAGTVGLGILGGASAFGCARQGYTDVAPIGTDAGNSGGSTGDAGGVTTASLCPAIGIGTSIFSAPCASGGRPTAAWSPLRRVSRIEYNGMVRDLLGTTSHPADKFVAESPLARGVNFQANTCTGIGASDTYVPEQYLEAAEALAQGAVADPNSLSNLLNRYGLNASCAVQSDGCADAFIHAFANRAFRGQLDAEAAIALLHDVYMPIKTQFDFVTGIQAVITSVLASPRFLYVLEFGQSSGAESVVPLSPQELATRLSLFLWRSLPDDSLLRAAESTLLATPDQIRTQAVRMLSDARALAALDDFATQWMELENADSLTKDSQYKTWNAAQTLAAELKGETLATFHFTTLETDPALGSFTTLLTSPSSYMNQDVKAFYSGAASLPGGCMNPADAACFQKTSLAGPSNPRAGILTDAMVLAARSHTSFPSPTLRGKLVREQILCDPVSPPPAGLNIPPPPTTVPAGQTIKQKYAAHGTGGCGAGCHDYMDKIGDAFGVYDATGTYQLSENDERPDSARPFPAIDPSGQVVSFGTGEFATTFSGPVDLVNKLAAATQVQQCFALQEFRYALSRPESPADACSVQLIFQKFAEQRLNLKELLLAVVQSDAFRYRTRVIAGGACR